MNPTESSSVPSCNACASAGVAAKVTSASAGGPPSPCSLTCASSTRAHDRACCFLPCATTNSTSTVALSDSREQVVFELTVARRAIDQRTREYVFLPRKHLADDV